MKTKTKKFLSFFLTVVMLFGTVAIAIPTLTIAANAQSYTEIPKNQDFTYNGITYRLDTYSGNSDSYARINADGTIEFKIRHGDMLWFPDLKMTDNSVVHAEVTAVSDPINIFHGLAYDVKAASANSHWSSAMIQVFKTAARYRITPATYDNLGKISGSDRGNGGDSPRVVDTSFTTDEKNLNAYKKLMNSNNDWAQGKTASFDLSKSDGKVSLTWGAANVGAIHTETYTDGAANVTYPYAGGSIGYAPVWTSSDNYITMRLECLTVSNCTIGGNATNLFSAVGTPVTPHTNFVVNGETYRFDPQPEHNLSSCFVMADNTIRVRMLQGDLLWMPETDFQLNSATMDVKLLTSDGGANNSQMAGGLAYKIDDGGNGAWDNASDTANHAIITTSWRSGIYNRACNGADSYGTAVVANAAISEGDRDSENFYYGSNGVWAAGRIARYSISTNHSQTVTASFGNTSGAVLTTSSYSVGSGNKEDLRGPIGFLMDWTTDYSVFDISNVSYQKTNTYSYELDFSEVPDMELSAGYNWVGGHLLNYVKVSGGRAYIQDGKLYMEGRQNDMLLFEDLNVDHLQVTLDMWMTYQADPQNGWFGVVSNLSDAVKNINKNPVDFNTGDLVRTASVSAITPTNIVMQFLKYKADNAGIAPYLEYTNGATKTTGMVVGTEYDVRVWTGRPGNGDGKIGLYVPAIGWTNGSGNNYTHSNKFQSGLHGLVFSSQGSGDSLISVKVSKIVISALDSATQNNPNAFDGNAKEVLKNNRIAYINDSKAVGLITSTNGSRAFINANNDVVVRMNKGDTFTVTGLTDNDWVKIPCINTEYPNDATVTRSGNTLTCTNAGATVIIKNLNVLEPANKIYDVLGSLSLDGTIKLNVKCNINLKMDPATKFVATLAGKEIANVNVFDTWNDTEKSYLFSVPVTAKEMTDSINVCVKIGDETVPGTSYTFTVKTLAQAIATAEPGWSDLMNAMLKYGAAAQNLFNYNTGNLAANLAGLTYDTSKISQIKATGDASFLATASGTLTLESGTDLNLYFKAQNPLANLTASVTDASGNPVDVLTETTTDGFFAVRIRNLAADQLAENFVITLSDGTKTVDLTYSALCWVKAVLDNSGSTENMKNIAKGIGVYASAAAQKKNKPLISASSVATGMDVVALRSTSDGRIASIRNSANDTSLIWTGSSVKNYYVSFSTGSDSNDGTTEAKPFKTLTKLSTVVDGLSTSYKVNIYLKRGDTWRGEQIAFSNRNNVTITTYGAGAKPVLMGSYENGANASKWTQVATNIWKYQGSESWADVGNIVFKQTANGEELWGRKIVQLYVKQDSWASYRLTNFSHSSNPQEEVFSSYTDLKYDLDFFHDKNFDGGTGATGALYLYSTSNPGTRFASIEFAPKINLISLHKVNNIKIDNICCTLTGAHGIQLTSSENMSILQNILIENSEFSWIGGSIQDRIKNSVIGTNTAVFDLRYGNAIEIYGGCNNFRVQNNYIHQVYDAGITFQKTVGSTSYDYSASNVNFTNNVIENCNYSIEYFLTEITGTSASKITTFNITNNIMWNAGYGFCETRGAWGLGFSAHIKSQKTNPCNPATDFNISGNTMVGVRDQFFGIRSSKGGTASLPTITNNTFYAKYDFAGTALSASGCRFGEVRYISDGSSDEHYASYDLNCDAYLTEQGVTNSGNNYFFLVADTWEK